MKKMRDTVLIVDDEYDLLHNLKEILVHHGFRVFVCKSVEQAYEVMDHEEVDLILCDIMMEGKDGLQFLNEIRDQKRFYNTPFIFLTARVAREDQRKGIEQGADDYLTKPFASRELINAIRSAILKKKKREYWINEKIDSAIKNEREIKLHELKTPLFGLIGLLELLLFDIESTGNTDLIENFNLAISSAIRINHSINKLQRFQGLENLAGSKIGLSLGNLINSKLKVYEKEKIKFDLDKGVDVFFNEDQLNFILGELIENALKFNCGSRPVEIKFHNNVFMIKNFQKIFKPSDKVKIDPFFQPNRGLHEQQGLGIGLYLAKEYCNRNGVELLCRVDKYGFFIAQIKFILDD